MSKGSYVLEGKEALAPYFAMRPVVKKQSRPWDTGVVFKGVGIYVISDNFRDATNLAGWLLQQKSPHISECRQSIKLPTLNLAVTNIGYSKDTFIALQTTNGERIGQFMAWMKDKIGSPPDQKQDKVIWTN